MSNIVSDVISKTWEFTKEKPLIFGPIVLKVLAINAYCACDLYCIKKSDKLCKKILSPTGPNPKDIKTLQENRLVRKKVLKSLIR